jgi:hypothetical protein
MASRSSYLKVMSGARTAGNIPGSFAPDILNRRRRLIGDLSISPGAGATDRSAGPPDLEELRKTYRDDENERRPIPPLPRPSGTYPETIRPSRLLWTCVGTWPGQPIYSQPDVKSKPVGMTTWAVVAGSDAGNFVRVLMARGRVAQPFGFALTDPACGFPASGSS